MHSTEHVVEAMALLGEAKAIMDKHGEEVPAPMAMMYNLLSALVHANLALVWPSEE